MKILKSFKLFESGDISEVPARFIPLESIGQYLDPDDGMTYAMLNKGGYEDEPYEAEDYLQEDEEEWEALSDEEKVAIKSVWKNCEEIVKPFIDWNLIEDIKDVALANEVLDNGLFLKIDVKERDLVEIVYSEWYAHNKDDKYYPKFFKKLFSEISNTDGDFSYHIRIYKQNGHGGYLPISNSGEPGFYFVDDLVEQVKGMNPDKELRIFGERW